jgi:rhomboid family GlyGly-CTERM serine protease
MTLANTFSAKSFSDSVRRIPITLTISGLAILLHFAGGLGTWLSFQFNEVAAYDFARLLGCHLLHWSTEHLFWDLAAFAVLGAACEWRSPRRYAWTLLLTAILVPLCVMFWVPQVGSYRGLSGIDTALFGLLVSSLIVQRIKDRETSGALFYTLLLVGLFCKIAIEMISEKNIFVSDVTFTPVPIAHLVGAAIGLAIGTYQEKGLSSNASNTATCIHPGCSQGIPISEIRALD